MCTRLRFFRRFYLTQITLITIQNIFFGMEFFFQTTCKATTDKHPVNIFGIFTADEIQLHLRIFPYYTAFEHFMEQVFSFFCYHFKAV